MNKFGRHTGEKIEGVHDKIMCDGYYGIGMPSHTRVSTLGKRYTVRAYCRRR